MHIVVGPQRQEGVGRGWLAALHVGVGGHDVGVGQAHSDPRLAQSVIADPAGLLGGQLGHLHDGRLHRHLHATSK